MRPGLALSVRRWAQSPVALVLVWAVVLAAFWRSRIAWGVPSRSIRVGNWDLHVSYLPRTEYVFKRLADGDLPLWNPELMTGQPLLALPATGLFYPPNWLYLVVDVTRGIELQYLLHAFFGGICMFLFLRQLSFARVAAVAGAAAFVGSGFAVDTTYQPVLFACLMWFPALLSQTVAVVEGRRLGIPLLSFAVAMAWLTGANEVFLHGALLASVVGIAASWRRFSTEGVLPLLPLASCAVAAALGLGLTGLQLLPSLELVELSVRAPGALSVKEAYGGVPFTVSFFLRSMLGGAGPSWTGVALVVLGPFAFRRQAARPFVVALAILGLLAIALMITGPISRAYADLPVVGSLFRRTIKFADVYATCAAFVGAAAVHGAFVAVRCEDWRGAREPMWLLSLALLAGGAGLVTSYELPMWPLLLSLPPLLLLGLARRPDQRTVGVVAAVGAFLFVLFAREPVGARRPIDHPGWAMPGKITYRAIHPEKSLHRLYVAPPLTKKAPFSPKLGMVHGVPILGDYEPLTTLRQARYFNFAAAGHARRPFEGEFQLLRDARWTLIRLAGVSEYLGGRKELRPILAARGREVRSLSIPLNKRAGSVGLKRFVKERNAIPRAFLTSEARVIEKSDRVLLALGEPEFDPLRTAILEEPLAVPLPEPNARDSGATVSIEEYEPERVVIRTTSESPGVLVLTDSYYPGWRVRVDGESAELLRADYLFRGVRLDAGVHVVEFSFEPESFQRGIALSLVSALVWLAIVALRLRAPR